MFSQMKLQLEDRRDIAAAWKAIQIVAFVGCKSIINVTNKQFCLQFRLRSHLKHF